VQHVAIVSDQIPDLRRKPIVVFLSFKLPAAIEEVLRELVPLSILNHFSSERSNSFFHFLAETVIRVRSAGEADNEHGAGKPVLSEVIVQCRYEFSSREVTGRTEDDDGGFQEVWGKKLTGWLVN
jgi:hypothetical protein